MTENLKREIAKHCAMQLKKILLIQQDLITMNREAGVKVYSLEEYNMLMSRLFPNGIYLANKQNNITKMMEADLSSNLFLSVEEITELTEEFERALTKYDLKKGQMAKLPITDLVSYVLEQEWMEQVLEENKDPKTINDRWKLTLSSSVPLGLNAKLMIYYAYNDCFVLQDALQKYICDLDVNGRDRIEEIVSFRRSTDQIYLTSKLLVVMNKALNQLDVVYQAKDQCYSIYLKDFQYSKEEILNGIPVNQLLSKIGLKTDWIYTEEDILLILEKIDRYFSYDEVILELVSRATKYWQEVIFNHSVNEVNAYSNLIPIYTEDQQKNFCHELESLIIEKILKTGVTELNIDPSFNNDLIQLLDNLCIICSPTAIGKLMKIDLESQEVVVIDSLANKKELIYGRNKKNRVKKKSHEGLLEV